LSAETSAQTAETPLRRQVAALPWRRGPEGLEIMLVTSRETRRWVVPKGGLMAGLTDAEAAAQEALEEAGIEGEIAAEPIGEFRYLKVLKRRAPRWYRVAVYPLRVEIERDTWDEAHERDRVWFGRETAADLVAEPDLRDLIRAFLPG
jgi:8-oxo-dGTP pyrophosphatase MutT (NUDIX family)